MSIILSFCDVNFVTQLKWCLLSLLRCTVLIIPFATNSQYLGRLVKTMQICYISSKFPSRFDIHWWFLSELSFPVITWFIYLTIYVYKMMISQPQHFFYIGQLTLVQWTFPCRAIPQSNMTDLVVVWVDSYDSCKKKRIGK